jgi:hypothetical protein
MVSLGINTCFIPLSCQLRGLFASKHSLMTVLSNGGDSGVSDRRLLPDASSFTGFWYASLRPFLTENITHLTWLSAERVYRQRRTTESITVDSRRLLFGEGINCHSHINYLMQNSLTRSFCCVMLIWRHIIRLRTTATLFIFQNLFCCKNTMVIYLV